MLRAALFVFSGTGNTAVVADMLANAFMGLEVQTETYRIDKVLKDGIPETTGFDFLGIGYPIYAFNTPKMVLDFVKRLPDGAGKKVFIFKTAGEPFPLNNTSSGLIIRRLEKKGYRAVYERQFLMPYNIIFRYPDALAKQMYTTGELLAKDLVKRLIAGEEYRIRQHVWGRAISFIFRIQWPGAALNGRLCTAGKKCTMCRKCLKSCPVGNISEKNGKIRFGWKCIMCMRCAMNCPHRAIRFGLLNLWVVNGAYDFERISNNPDIPSLYINENTKGYFKHFKKYYRWVESTVNGKK